MGCDIHLYVEVKDESGAWKSADTWEKGEGGELYVDYKKSFYTGRNYSLFAMLADVRNGRGFAGVDTGNAVTPIREPRGIPEDASPEYKAEVEIWGSDGHSHSYLTVSELMAYDWTKTQVHRGYLNFQTWGKWCIYGREEGEFPEAWCGGTTLPTITEEQANRVWDNLPGKSKMEKLESPEAKGLPMVHSEWETPYYKSAMHFLSNCLPKLWRLGKPEDVRIVFFFDN